MSKIIGAHTPSEIRNLAINGAFDFWQRVEGSTTTVNTATTTSGYAADMFTYDSGGSTVKNYSIARSATIPTVAQSGFQSTYSLLATMVTGIASFAASDYVEVCQYRMEGLDFEKIHQKTVTFGFWAQASVTGTYSFALRNGSTNRSYVTTFTINGASTWQFISISVQMDTVGTWNFDNTNALYVDIGSYAGTTYATSTLNSWQAGSYVVASSATNWMATSSATFQIAQFSIVEGPLGFSATGFARNGRSIQQELALCQRYYEKSYPQGVAPGTANENGCYRNIATDTQTMSDGGKAWFKVPKRLPGTYTLVQFYSDTTGTAGKVHDNNSSSDTSITPTNFNWGENYVTIEGGAVLTAGHFYTAHWTVDCGL